MNLVNLEPGSYYHIFNRGNNKEDIFKESKNYNYFLNLMSKYLPEISEVFAYCLLPNHFHLLLRIKEKSQLHEGYSNSKRRISQPMSNLFNTYTKAINKSYDRTGSLFQKHPHRIKIGDANYFRELVLYIHLNPEKHQITHNYSGYPYSSFNSYLTKKESLLNREFVIDQFNDLSNFIKVHEMKKVRLGILKNIEEIDG